MIQRVSTAITFCGCALHMVCCGIPFLMGILGLAGVAGVAGLNITGIHWYEAYEVYILAGTGVILLLSIGLYINGRRQHRANMSCGCTTNSTKADKMRWVLPMVCCLYAVNIASFFAGTH